MNANLVGREVEEQLTNLVVKQVLKLQASPDNAIVKSERAVGDKRLLDGRQCLHDLKRHDTKGNVESHSMQKQNVYLASRLLLELFKVV